jgi:hypothetical protein
MWLLQHTGCRTPAGTVKVPASVRGNNGHGTCSLQRLLPSSRLETVIVCITDDHLTGLDHFE